MFVANLENVRVSKARAVGPNGTVDLSRPSFAWMERLRSGFGALVDHPCDVNAWKQSIWEVAKQCGRAGEFS